MQTSQQSPASWDFWSEGLDRMFLSRSYQRAGQIGGVLTLALLIFEQKAAALGLASGLALALFSTWTLDVAVRLLFRGGRFAGVKLAIAAFVKMPFLLASLVGIAWAADKHIVNVFAVVGGVLLLHATMLAMVIATSLAAHDSNHERYR